MTAQPGLRIGLGPRVGFADPVLERRDGVVGPGPPACDAGDRGDDVITLDLEGSGPTNRSALPSDRDVNSETRCALDHGHATHDNRHASMITAAWAKPAAMATQVRSFGADAAMAATLELLGDGAGLRDGLFAPGLALWLGVVAGPRDAHQRASPPDGEAAGPLVTDVGPFFREGPERTAPFRNSISSA